MESTTDQPVQLHGKMEYLHRKKAVDLSPNARSRAS